MPCNANQKMVRGILCSLAAALLLLRATRASRPCMRGGPNARVPLSLVDEKHVCVYVCVCPHEPCHLHVASLRPCSSPPISPLLSLFAALEPASPESTVHPLGPGKSDVLRQASSFNRKTSVRKAWCLCPGAHEQNGSAKSRQHTLPGLTNRKVLPLLLTEATPYLRCMNTWCVFVRPVEGWRHGVRLVPTCSAWQEGVTMRKAFAVESNTRRGTRFCLVPRRERC